MLEIICIFAGDIRPTTLYKCNMVKMKNYILIVICLLAGSVYATPQDADVIYIDGERWNLQYNPIAVNPSLNKQLEEILPEGRDITTANWDGYTAYWSIKEDMICLDSVTVTFTKIDEEKKETISDGGVTIILNYDQIAHTTTQKIPQEKLLSIFKDYVKGEKIIATWLTCDMMASKGENIITKLGGSVRNFDQETELTFTVKNGVVSNRQLFHNKFVTEGISFSDFKDPETIRKLLPLNIKDYPRLKEGCHVLFRLSDFIFDSDGNLLDCTVKATTGKGDKCPNSKRLSKDMKQLLRKIHPWQTILIRGKIVTDIIDHIRFVYIF